jgi:CxxC motif-containing protein
LIIPEIIKKMINEGMVAKREINPKTIALYCANIQLITLRGFDSINLCNDLEIIIYEYLREIFNEFIANIEHIVEKQYSRDCLSTIPCNYIMIYDLTIWTVSENGCTLKYACDEMKDNETVVMTAVKQNGMALEYVSPELRNNNELVISAVMQNGYSLKFASPELQGNEEVVNTAIKGYSIRSLQFASDKLRNNTKFILAAVKNNGYALQFASPELRDNEDIVMTAIKLDGDVLQYASPKIKNNKNIVISAVMENGYSLRFVSPELQDNKEVVLTAVKQSGWALEFAPKFQDDLDVVTFAVIQHEETIQFASIMMMKNYKDVEASIRSHGYNSPDLYEIILQYGSRGKLNNWNRIWLDGGY